MDWKTCCEEMRSERLKKRIRQADIEEATGISETTIVNWENGHNSPTLDRFIDVLDVLGLELKIVRKKEE